MVIIILNFYILGKFTCIHIVNFLFSNISLNIALGLYDIVILYDRPTFRCTSCLRIGWPFSTDIINSLFKFLQNKSGVILHFITFIKIYYYKIKFTN